MTAALLYIVLASLVICGARAIVDPERELFLARLGTWAGNQKGWLKHALKPVMTCSHCMASLWSAGVLLYFEPMDQAVRLWPPVALGTCFLAGLLYALLRQASITTKLSSAQYAIQTRINPQR